MKFRYALTGAGLTAALVLATPLSALAAWDADAAGSAGLTAQAATLPALLPPSATAHGSSVRVVWPITTSFPVRGYRVARLDPATGASDPATGACSGLLTVPACTERDVPPGHWSYRVVAVVGENWTTPAAAGPTVLVSPDTPATARPNPSPDVTVTAPTDPSPSTPGSPLPSISRSPMPSPSAASPPASSSPAARPANASTPTASTGAAATSSPSPIASTGAAATSSPEPTASGEAEPTAEAEATVTPG